MTDPFRLRVQKAIAAALEEITVANGYQQDLAGAVFRGRLGFGSTDPLPMISILEPPVEMPRNAAPASTPVADGEWQLVIQGFGKDERQNPTDPAHVLMADVKKRLSQETARRGNAPGFHGADPFFMGRASGKNHIESLKIGPGVVRPPDDISDKAYFWLTVNLKIVEDNSDPFS
mgnify:CR=1 FL=1